MVAKIDDFVADTVIGNAHGGRPFAYFSLRLRGRLHWVNQRRFVGIEWRN
jgi:hypothetical protein